LRFAGGMQNKVALSMGLGVPVVATSAATGWLPDAGKSLVRVADDAETFAAKVIEVLKNPKKAKAQAAKGKKFVVKNYQWKTAGQKLEKVLKQAVR
jgi:polysaccharide biosynthesis protein PslH